MGKNPRTNGHDPNIQDEHLAAPGGPARDGIAGVPSQHAIDRGQRLSDADQSAADADQTSSDSDETASAADQAIADSEQIASDRDQEAADRELAANGKTDPVAKSSYELSRDERKSGSFERLHDRQQREATARERDATAQSRDRTADDRDESARSRFDTETDPPRVMTENERELVQQMDALRAAAVVDRERAAQERAAAAADRERAAVELARLEAELRSAHLDPLTGAFRREMGDVALTHEITRARRSDGRFVLAFVDVDRLKEVNDRDGHAAGDRVLQTVVRTIRTNLRSFDPIIRYGGDEFVCGLSGTDVDEAERRFISIGIAIQAEARVGISVGLAALAAGDDADQLTERADAAMLAVKAIHHGAL